MADLFSSISQNVLPKIGQDPSRASGLRTWIETGSYRISESNVPTELLLTDLRLAELVPYYSFDYERFAFSSFETFAEVIAARPSVRFVGWSLLKIYYSAFFACHAIMRVCGGAVIKLDRQHTDVLQAVADPVLNQPFVIEPGMFAVRISQEASGAISAKLAPLKSSGGAHEVFWRAFDAFLDQLSTRAITNNAPDAESFVAGVAELQPLFRPHNRRRSPWLSAVRNEINYQHELGVWEPRTMSRGALGVVAGISEKSSKSIRLDYSLDKHDVEAFVSGSQYFAALNIEIANIIAANSKSARSFGQKWRRMRSSFI